MADFFRAFYIIGNSEEFPIKKAEPFPDFSGERDPLSSICRN
ncbi:hypothetical protein CLOM621_09054 [Clostridium sp. M62/1]|nr:hypothetical protein CLOM621_09054 [Clostridium sp. M62/1]